MIIKFFKIIFTIIIIVNKRKVASDLELVKDQEEESIVFHTM